MKVNRRAFLTMGTAAATIAFSELGRSRPSLAQSSSAGVLNLYSARHYDTDEVLYQRFTDRTGIAINLIEADADQLIERIKSEGANSPADVFITVDAGRLWRAQQDGLFQPISSATLEEVVPSYLRDPDGHWFGLSKRARVIMYNKERVNPTELSTYENLVDPKWRGRIVVRSSTHVYNQSLVGSMLEANGAAATEEWVRGLVANFARPPEGNDTAQIQSIAAGLGDLAISNTYYLPRLAKSEDPAEREVADKVGVFFPNQRDRGTHVNISGGGVLKNAPNKEAAIQFLEHLLSEESQEVFAVSNNEYPVRSGVTIDPVLQSYGSFEEDSMSAAAFGRNNAEALRIMDRAGWR